jgi:hypothetical protein
MRLGQRNQPIQTFAADGADQALANRICLRAARWGFQNADTELCDRCIQMLGEYAVAIVKQESASILGPNDFAQLLQCPLGGWMGRDIEMNQAAATVLDHDEQVQQAKGGGDDEREITCNNALSVQAQEGRPA